MQSSLDPRGPVAAEIALLWWVLLGICGAAFALIVGLALYAVYRRPEKRPRLRHGAFVLGGGLLFPTVSVIGLLVYGTEIGRRIVAEGEGPVLRVAVTGRQWWWEVHYPAAAGEPAVTTANELVLPAGRPTEIMLRSADVIHSFWVPALAGKLDVVPGHEHALRLEASRPDRLRGQCAEFCGAQHARMAFGVIVLDPDEFAAWRNERGRDAALPSQLAPSARAGFDAFVDEGCALCHRVRGAVPGSGIGDPLTGVRGPDLTHVAAREMIGARTLPYSRDNAALWIREHQRLKPGNRMLDFSDLPDETVEAIADYLDTLR